MPGQKCSACYHPVPGHYSWCRLRYRINLRILTWLFPGA
jgi:hypothetical protein